MSRTSTKTTYMIRMMELEDIEQVMAIDKASFPTPWPEEIFKQEIRDNEFAFYYVLEHKGKIIGYAGTWMILGDAQVTNIALLPEMRGKKLGERLFKHVLSQAMMIGMERLSLEVRVSNVIAQKMYRKFGLVPGGVRKNYYSDNNEDAIVMWVDLT